MEWIPNLEARSLTWLLDALQGAGFSKEESLIAEGITRLLNLQDEHGYWDEGKPSAVETTVTALRVLLDYGCIPIPEN